MNIGSFILDGIAQYGVFRGQAVIPATSEFLATYPTLRDVLDNDALAMLTANTTDRPAIPTTDITFLPPIPNPRKIICVGMNYRKPYPVDGIAPPTPDNVILFGKERGSMVAHGTSLQIPTGDAANSFDYEGEIAVVIGKTAHHVSVQDAMNHVLGYAPFNDGSVRDWQKHSIYAGKNFSRSGSWGPWITTADALPDPADMELTVSLNGEVVQHTFGREMIFSVAEQIAYASHLFPLRPGDVIATGSPDGTGGSHNPKRYLKQDDFVEISIGSAAKLTNWVSQ